MLFKFRNDLDNLCKRANVTGRGEAATNLSVREDKIQVKMLVKVSKKSNKGSESENAITSFMMEGEQFFIDEEYRAM